MTIARKSWKKRTINPYFGTGDKMISFARIGVKNLFCPFIFLKVEGGG